jgi:hypothetical protein
VNFVPNRQREQFGCCCCARELHRFVSVIFSFAVVAVASAQNQTPNAGATNAGITNLGTTNIDTNEVGPETVLTNMAPTTNEAPGVTNLFGVTPVVPPVLGPKTVGGNGLGAPVMGTSVFAPAGGVPAALGAGIPVWGPIDVHPRMLYSFLYGTGIEAQPGQQSKTSINTISPGLLFDLGTHWRLDYTPSYAIYSDPAFRNTLTEVVSLSGHTSYEDWAFSFAQTYITADEPLVETGTQTSEETYGTIIGAAYQMGSKLSLQLAANQNFLFAESFDNVRSWSGSAGLNYQFMPKFGMGISLAGGYNDVSAGSSSPFESLQGTMNFHPGPKLTMSFSGGIEDMQFVHPSAPALVSPIYSGSLQYRPFNGTAVSLTASRSVTPAYYGNQIEEATSVGAAVSQQLTKKLTLSVNAGYSSEPLTEIVAAPLPQFFLGAPPRTALSEDQENNTTSLTISLSYLPIKNGAITVSYSKSDNSSGQANFSYSSSQIGLTLSYQY